MYTFSSMDMYLSYCIVQVVLAQWLWICSSRYYYNVQDSVAEVSLTQLVSVSYTYCMCIQYCNKEYAYYAYHGHLLLQCTSYYSMGGTGSEVSPTQLVSVSGDFSCPTLERATNGLILLFCFFSNVKFVCICMCNMHLLISLGRLKCFSQNDMHSFTTTDTDFSCPALERAINGQILLFCFFFLPCLGQCQICLHYICNMHLLLSLRCLNSILPMIWLRIIMVIQIITIINIIIIIIIAIIIIITTLF